MDVFEKIFKCIKDIREDILLLGLLAGMSSFTIWFIFSIILFSFFPDLNKLVSLIPYLIISSLIFIYFDCFKEHKFLKIGFLIGFLMSFVLIILKHFQF